LAEHLTGKAATQKDSSSGECYFLQISRIWCLRQR